MPPSGCPSTIRWCVQRTTATIRIPSERYKTQERHSSSEPIWDMSEECMSTCSLSTVCPTADGAGGCALCIINTFANYYISHAVIPIDTVME